MTEQVQVAVVGGRPAGLMAAEVLSDSGLGVTVYERMPTLGRKFLLAGKSGLNLTHAEDEGRFKARFGAAGTRLRPALDAFTPTDLRAWASTLGIETFVGSSGRVFPSAMKASPLLRAWLRRLGAQGVTLRARHRWTGFDDDGALTFETPQGPTRVRADATVLALGGASWPQLGSDGAWVPWLRGKAVEVADFRPANCGFDVAWSQGFSDRFAGEPVKAVAAASSAGSMQGEFVITRTGIEGGLVYAHAAALRDELAADGWTALTLDLAPGRGAVQLVRGLGRQPGKSSFANRLRKGAGISGVKAALLRELTDEADRRDPARLAAAIKALTLPLVAPRPIAEAVSSAGGVSWAGIDENFMLRALPGVFVAGEMLDWEAPTGGYLLTACLSGGRAAGRGAEVWLRALRPQHGAAAAPSLSPEQNAGIGRETADRDNSTRPLSATSTAGS